MSAMSSGSLARLSGTVSTMRAAISSAVLPSFSDITRTIWVGGLSELEKKVYTTVRDGQRKALEAIRPGKLGMEIDAAAQCDLVFARSRACTRIEDGTS